MSQFIGRPPPGISGQTMRVLAVCQVFGAFYDHWFRLEGLKEDRARRQQDLVKEEALLKAQLAAFTATLEAQVGAEAARAQSFIAAMQALAAIQDPEVIRQVLEMSRDLLSRPLVVPHPGGDWGG